MTIDQTVSLLLYVSTAIWWIVTSFMAFGVEIFNLFSKNKL